MGMPLSIIARGMVDPLAQMLYVKLVHRNITNFDDFHIAILDVMGAINSAVPGNRYEVPDEGDAKKCFDAWKLRRDGEQKKQFLRDFILEKVKMSKGSTSVAITGLVVPPIAMALRRKGEQNLPQLKVLNAVPDAVFVPFITLIALSSVKLGRKIFH